jgi:hypothetical protein
LRPGKSSSSGGAIARGTVSVGAFFADLGGGVPCTASIIVPLIIVLGVLLRVLRLQSICVSISGKRKQAVV